MTTKQKIYHRPLGKPVSANDRTYHVTMWVARTATTIVRCTSK